jgi:hypothetical protein
MNAAIALKGILTLTNGPVTTNVILPLKVLQLPQLLLVASVVSGDVK